LTAKVLSSKRNDGSLKHPATAGCFTIAQRSGLKEDPEDLRRINGKLVGSTALRWRTEEIMTYRRPMTRPQEELMVTQSPASSRPHYQAVANTVAIRQIHHR
jgi:hypothetical protein